MPSWNELIEDLEKQLNDKDKDAYLKNTLNHYLSEVSRLREGRNVIFYASAFLNKPHLTPFQLQITNEEINGLMSVMYGMDWSKGLTLILHTPGGITNAAETIVAYLHSKFEYIEVVIPTFAMSAGTMISLAANKIIMGRQSQLGPIDAQLPIGGRFVSARAIVDQFERAKSELNENIQLAHLWAPILNSLGPALLQEAQNALEYGQKMVKKWLASRMFHDKENKGELASKVAEYFSVDESHKSHGRRIDRDEARSQNIDIDDLEDSQELQEAVLTSYHMMTIIFEKSPASKVLVNNNKRMWVKNAREQTMPIQMPIPKGIAKLIPKPMPKPSP